MHTGIELLPVRYLPTSCHHARSYKYKVDSLLLVDVVDLRVGGLIVQGQFVTGRELLQGGMTLHRFRSILRVDVLKKTFLDIANK